MRALQLRLAVVSGSLPRSVVSLAKSASSMPPCAADRFDEMLVRLFTVCDRRFDTAPNFERWMFTVFIALSMAVIAAIAFEGLSRVGPDDEDDEPLPDIELLLLSSLLAGGLVVSIKLSAVCDAPDIVTPSIV